MLSGSGFFIISSCRREWAVASVAMAEAETGVGDGWQHHTAHKPPVSCDGFWSQQAAIIVANSRMKNGFFSETSTVHSVLGKRRKLVGLSLKVCFKKQWWTNFREGRCFMCVPELWQASLGSINSLWLHAAFKGRGIALYFVRVIHLHRLLRLCGLPACTKAGGGRQILLPLLQWH